MKPVLSGLLILLFLLCGCHTQPESQVPDPTIPDIMEGEGEWEQEAYQAVTAAAYLNEDYCLGQEFAAATPAYLTIGILEQYGLLEEATQDGVLALDNQEIREIASLLLPQEALGSYQGKYAVEGSSSPHVLLEPLSVQIQEGQADILYGRFVEDSQGNIHWLYPVHYQAELYQLAKEEIPGRLQDHLQPGDLFARLQSVENITQLSDAVSYYAQYGYGELVEDKVYELNSPQDLEKMAQQVNTGLYRETHATYLLQNDIDLTDVTFTPIGQGDTPVPLTDPRLPMGKGFCGVFSGQGYTISHLTICQEIQDDQEGTVYLGFFSTLGEGATVQDLILSDAQVEGTSQGAAAISAGILAGEIQSAWVDNCFVSGSVTGTVQVGGLAGTTTESGRFSRDQDRITEISRCHSDVQVKGNTEVGGLIGLHHNTITSYCTATGSVTAVRDYTGAPATQIGGMVGHHVAGQLFGCAFQGEVRTLVTAHFVGTLVGLNEGDLYDCWYDYQLSPWKGIGETTKDTYVAESTGISTTQCKKKILALRVNES